MTTLYRRSATGLYVPQYNLRTEPAIIPAPGPTGWTVSDDQVFNTSNCSLVSGPGPMSGTTSPFFSNSINGNIVEAHDSALPALGDQFVMCQLGSFDVTVQHVGNGIGVMARYGSNHALYLAATARNPGVDQSLSWEAGHVTFPTGNTVVISGNDPGNVLILIVTGTSPNVNVTCKTAASFQNYLDGILTTLGTFVWAAGSINTGIGGIVGGFGSFSGGGVFCENHMGIQTWNWGNVASVGGNTPANPDHRRGSGYSRRGFKLTANNP